MISNYRLIPIILIKNEEAVKSKKFKEFKYLGDPINIIKIFNEKFVNEIFIFDISRSVKNLQPNFNFLEKMAQECFIPLGYGGGIRNTEDAKKIIRIGFEKVSLQKAAILNPTIVKEISSKLGSQATVLSIDIKYFKNEPKIYIKSLKKTISENIFTYTKKLIQYGAGELHLNFIDRDGLREGMDINLINQFINIVDIPIIATGGIGSIHHLKEAFSNGVQNIGVGSFFTLRPPHDAVLISYIQPKDIVEKYL